jgi:hypothetical protein
LNHNRGSTTQDQGDVAEEDQDGWMDNQDNNKYLTELRLLMLLVLGEAKDQIQLKEEIVEVYSLFASLLTFL